MGISWSQVIGAQDDALETQLARRDMSKQMQMLLTLAREQEGRRQFERGAQLDERQLLEQTRLREAQQAETQRQHDELRQSRAIDDERQQLHLLLGRPAGTVFQQPETEFLTKKGFAGDLTPNEGGGAMFRRQEAERLAAKLAQDEKFEQERLKNERERLVLAQRNEQRQQEEEDRRKTREGRAVQAHEQRMKQLKKQSEDYIPVALRPQFNKSVDEAFKQAQPGWLDIGAEQVGREEVFARVMEEWRKKGLVPDKITTPPPQGQKTAGKSRFVIEKIE